MPKFKKFYLLLLRRWKVSCEHLTHLFFFNLFFSCTFCTLTRVSSSAGSLPQTFCSKVPEEFRSRLCFWRNSAFYVLFVSNIVKNYYQETTWDRVMNPMYRHCVTVRNSAWRTTSPVCTNSFFISLQCITLWNLW